MLKGITNFKSLTSNGNPIAGKRMLQMTCALLLTGLAYGQAAVPAEDDASSLPDDRGAYPPAESHASQEADTELVIAMTNAPERYAGMTLVFVDGRVIGPIQELRRKIDDLELYLIVDATNYFNDETIYAVNAKDVLRVEGDQVQVTEEMGMHLRGLVYYPEDFTDVDDFNPEGYEVGDAE